MTIPRNRCAVARCACGRIYSASAWTVLPWDGDQPDGEIVLELRRCVCGSTISRARKGILYVTVDDK